MKTDKIREAILTRAKEDADKIVSDAGIKAQEMIEKAKDQRKQQLEEEKKKIISEAHLEASQILAQAALRSRQEILKQKDAVINDIIKKVRDELSHNVMGKEPFIHLILETIDAFGTEEKIRIYVSPEDIDNIREIIEENCGLKEKITEVKEIDCLGGILAENISGMVSINNTFDTRLEMLMPKILPEIGKKLFGIDEN